MIGDVRACDAAERPALKALYLQAHPNAFWVDFGDFAFYRMDRLVGCRYVGGFARAASPTPDAYLAAAAAAATAAAADAAVATATI